MTVISPKKQVYHILCKESNEDPSSYEINDHLSPYSFNDQFYDVLRHQKNLINQYNQSNQWDKYKKIMNEYELIYTSYVGFPNICNVNPISRSFFKLWELLHDFSAELPECIHNPQSNVRACCLAEGPGGFIEALLKYRQDIVKIESKDLNEIFGMTLISANKNVPNWKFSKPFIKDNNITLCFGKDGTGSLYKMHNITYLCEIVGRNTCDLVTADGGFDYSNDFNEQEDASLNLIMCEILSALLIQKKGGAFILKIFDISHTRMFQLLYMLYQHYNHMYFVKPFTSRPANSEKYLVCTNFKGPNYDIINILQTAIHMEYYNNKKYDFLKVPTFFKKEIIYFNTFYTMQQIKIIDDIINFISKQDTSKSEKEFLKQNKDILRCRISNAMRWCFKYNFNINITSLHYFNQILA